MGTYNASGHAATFTATNGGTYKIIAYGAQGGSSTDAGGHTGGDGAEVGGTFTLTAGETLQIVVGGAGPNYAIRGGLGGGGGSFVFEKTGSPGAYTYTPLLIAGGGGGADGYANGGYGLTSAGNDGSGGGGGSSAGSSGFGGGGGSGIKSDGSHGVNHYDVNTYGGGGGANRSGGYRGGLGYGGSKPAGSGGFGGGGGGADQGGGGGGGYSGGDGGSGGGGGGGGSIDKGSSFVAISGENAGNGKVVITQVVQAPPTGLAQAGAANNGGTVEITGSGDASGDTITIYNGGTVVGSGKAGAGGAFNITTTATFADGIYELTATDTGSLGTSTNSSPAKVVVGAAAPSITAVVGQPVNGGAVELQGSGDAPGDTITIYNGSTAVGSGTAGAGGAFDFSTTTKFADGTYQLTATDTGSLGTSANSAPATVVVGATAPSITAVVGQPVNGGTIELQGSGDASGDTITIYNGSTAVGSGTAGAGGAFDFATTATFSDGIYQLTATDTSADTTVTSAKSSTITVDVDPNALTITAVVGQPVNGGTIDVQGTGEVGDTVDLYADGNTNTIVGTETIGNGGTFDIIPTGSFAHGVHTFTATETDTANLTSAQSAVSPPVMGTDNYSGSIQKVTVTVTGTYDITAYGAQGGEFANAVYSTAGGKGAEIEGKFNLTAGETLEIVVGGYGGTGGASGGGGGGGTFVLANTGPGGSYVPLIVAGGGGGAGRLHNAGSAGSITAGSGAGGGGYSSYSGNGGGGGGAGFNGSGGAGVRGTNYGAGTGGYRGGFGGGYYTGEEAGGGGGFGGGGGGGRYGGGGGGGYSGGGGGGRFTAAGGGGSIDNGTSVLAMAGENAGDGKVTFTVTLPPPPIGSVAYDAAAGTLTLTGPDFASGFNAADLTLTGEGGKSYTLTSGTTAGTVSTNGAGISTVTFTLDAADQTQVALLLDQNGEAAQDGTGYGLTAAAGWDTGAAAVTTPVAVTASGVFNPPTITTLIGQPVNSGTVELEGTANTPGDTIDLYADGTNTIVGTAMVTATDGGATFDITTTTNFADGVHSFTATETTGNRTSAQSAAFTVDVDPNAPSNLAVVGQPVNGQDVTVTGTGETVNDTITLYNGTTELGTTTVVAGGTFSFTTTSPLADGVYGFTATETDASNLTSAKSAALTVDVDPNAPSNLAVVGQPVNGQDVTVTGTGETVNDTITLYNGTTELGTTTVVAGGTFSFTTTSPLADGVYGFTATETDASNLTSAKSAALTVDVDPNAPSNLAVLGQPVNGQDVTVTGTGETVNDTITLYNGTTELGTTTVVAGGTFSFTTTSPLADGVYGFTATETDASNLTSAKSALTVNVDPNAPVITTLVGQPVNGGTVELQGTGEAGDTVDLYADGNTTTIVGTGKVGSGGTFDITTSAPFADGSHSFTVTQTDTAGLTSAPPSPVSQSYGYSGKIQKVTVAATGTYDITAYGAQGGNWAAYGYSAAGGRGAEIEGKFKLTAGETLEIVVGGAGGGSSRSGGGGGGSFVLANTGPGGSYVPLVVAGGGGGAIESHAGGAGSTLAGSGFGGAGGGGGYSGGGGGGAGLKGAGRDGEGYFDRGTGGQDFRGGRYANAFGQGGGGGGYGGGGSGYARSGGGGGGYSGGNGGYKTSGAGGGSIDTGTYVLATAGENTGNGKVVLTSVVTAFTVDVEATAPSGLAQKGTASNGGTIEITGTGDASGDTITLYDGNTMLGSGTAGAGGAFDIVTTQHFADGSYDITATDTSVDGTETSVQSSAAIAIVQSTAPNGLAQKGTSSNGGTIEITGTGDAAGDTITLYNGNAVVGSGLAGANGAFDITTSATFFDGTYGITATDTSADTTETSGPSSAVSAIVQSVAPTGLAQKGTASNGGTIEITGTGDAAGDTITLYDGNTVVGSGLAGANGAFDITTSATFFDGTYSSITATDTSADTTEMSGPSSAVSAIVQSVAPTGLVQKGTPTDGGTIEITGIGDAAGDTITLYNGNTVVGSGLAGSNGAFDITTSATFFDGTYSITATDTSVDATETSAMSSPAISADVDPSAPAVTTLVGQPLTGQTVELQGTGEAGETVDLYADGNTDAIVGSGVVGAGGTFDITTTATFGTGSHDFTATEIDAARLTSAQSSPAFQVVVVHQAPAVTAGGTVMFDGAGPVVLDAGVTVSDVDSSGTLASATISISSGFVAGDTLEIGGKTSGTITGSGGTINYAFTGSALNLSGTDTLADYQAALGSITYSFSPPGGDATAGGADTSRTVSWQVNDGSASNGASDAATSALSVPPAPVLTTATAGVNASASEVFTPDQLFSVSDAAGEPILSYEVEDETAGASQGFWVLNGAVLTNGVITTLTSAQLSELKFVAGSASAPVTDKLEVAASDAAGFGAFTTFTVTASAHASTAAPTVSAANALAAPGLTLAAANLFSATASGGNSVSSYEVEDITPDSGHWVFNGVAEPTNQLTDVITAELSELSFDTGYGSDTLIVRANDGSQWGSSVSFTVTPPPNAAPPAATTSILLMERSTDGAYEFYDVGHNGILLDGDDAQIDPALHLAGIGGFDGSDTADLLMRDAANGTFTLYDVSNNNVTGHVALGQVGTEWQVAGFGDFSGNAGETDMLMRDSGNGAFEVYDISNNAITFASGMGQVGLEWQVAGFGDFSGNANETDMLMRNSNSGAFEVYDISHNVITSSGSMGQVGLEWQVAGFGDFSGHADETDMLMRNSSTGAFELYDISNNTITFGGPMGQVGLEWTIAGFGNFSGNANETDMLMRNSNTGAFELYDIANNAITSATSMGQVGSEWSVAGVAAGASGTAPSAQLSGTSIDPAGMPSSSASAQLTQAMASFAPGGGASDVTSPLAQVPAPEASNATSLTAATNHPQTIS